MKRWMWIALIVIVIAVIAYFVWKKKQSAKEAVAGTTLGVTTPNLSISVSKPVETSVV